jgi:two-component system nitrate/nitrite response regulator NarL
MLDAALLGDDLRALAAATEVLGGRLLVLFVSSSRIGRLTREHLLCADGIISDDLSAEAMIRSLRLIQEGERVVPRSLLSALTASSGPAPSNTAGDSPVQGVRLSPRERQILSYVVKGESSKGIARHLDIAEATIKVHLKSLFRKIGAANRTQAAIWGMQNCMVQDRGSLTANNLR